MGLSLRGEYDIRGHGLAPAGYINIKIANRWFHVKVAILEKNDILIGRDILNQLKLLLDGKNLEFEVMEGALLRAKT